MKIFAVLISAFVLLFGLAGAANAYSINYNYTASGNDFTSPYYATVEDFEGALAWNWAGSYAVVSGSLEGKYAAPAGVDGVNKDASKYVTVPNPEGGASGSVLVTGLPTSNYFGLWWGSMDTYNTLTFYLDGVATGESVTGSDVTDGGMANGAQTGPVTNHYVNFLDLKPYNSFRMSSSQFAFEADNIAIGVVPEPLTLILLGSGLLGLFGLRRKIS